MIKMVIADDIQILRQGLKAIFAREPDIQVAGLAADGKEAWELCVQKHPDVVLMDMRMPEYDGSYGIRRIKADFPEIKVLVLTTFDDRETVERAIASGADGYILKEMEDEKVIQSVKAVCSGIRVFGGSVFEEMRRQMTAVVSGVERGGRQEDSQSGDRGGCRPGGGQNGDCGGCRPGMTALPVELTPRERDTIRLVAQGMDNREIAAELFLAEGTVRNNISRLLEKLSLKDRTQLAVFAVKNNLDVY